MSTIGSTPSLPPLFQPPEPERAPEKAAEKASEKQRLDQVQISQEAQHLADAAIERGLA